MALELDGGREQHEEDGGVESALRSITTVMTSRSTIRRMNFFLQNKKFSTILGRYINETVVLKTMNISILHKIVFANRFITFA